MVPSMRVGQVDDAWKDGEEARVEAVSLGSASEQVMTTAF